MCTDICMAHKSTDSTVSMYNKALNPTVDMSAIERALSHKHYDAFTIPT